MTPKKRNEVLAWLRRPHPGGEAIPTTFPRQVLDLLIALDERITELELALDERVLGLEQPSLESREDQLSYVVRDGIEHLQSHSGAWGGWLMRARMALEGRLTIPQGGNAT